MSFDKHDKRAERERDVVVTQTCADVTRSDAGPYRQDGFQHIHRAQGIAAHDVAGRAGTSALGREVRIRDDKLVAMALVEGRVRIDCGWEDNGCCCGQVQTRCSGVVASKHTTIITV